MTSLLDRLRGRPSSSTHAAKAVTSLGPWGSGTPLSSLGMEPQDRAAACLRAYKVGWFYKAGRKIATDVAGLDWSISLGDAEEGDSEATLDRQPLQIPFGRLSPVDQLQRLLERPNPSQTGRQLMSKTQVRLDFAGAAAWYLEGGEGGQLPSAIYGISPARMWPSYANGRLIGWVMDKDAPSGGVPFGTDEILWFTTGSAADDDIWGTSVVEAVYYDVPLTELMARHTGDVLQTGGRLAGMLWPKERMLSEDEFTDAQRAWRNVASDPNAGRRMLIFPEPMEYAAGASTPAEIGIPELATLTRDDILTAFPLSPYQLGVPMPGGLNSGEIRREDRRDYWEGTIHPRIDLIEETIQTQLVPRYEAATGETYDFDIEEPNLDDAPTLIEKVGAYKGLVSIGFDPKESTSAVGLDHIKWNGLPALLDPAQQLQMQQQAAEAKQQASDIQSQAGDTSRRDQTTTTATVAKAELTLAEHFAKSRDTTAERYSVAIADFLEGQLERVSARLRDALPTSKALRTSFIKSPEDWWEAGVEDIALQKALHALYIDASKGSLQIVADELDRIVPGKAIGRILTDLQQYGAQRIADINAATLQALVVELSEGTRRGYSINQLIDGVPSEGFAGVKGVTLDNGIAVFGDYRAEVIARTETMLSYNRAALDGYKEFNVRQVLAHDGDHDYECAVRNGAVFDIDEALGIADHPNGTLDWAPVIDKAVHDDLGERLARIEGLLAAPKTEAPIIVEPHINLPQNDDWQRAFSELVVKTGESNDLRDRLAWLEGRLTAISRPQAEAQKDDELNEADMRRILAEFQKGQLTEDDVRRIVGKAVAQGPSFVVPSISYPDFVMNPVINVPEQAAPLITVNVPEQPTPVINVEAKPIVIDRTKTTTVKADTPSVQDVRVVDSTLPPKRKRVKRDQQGRITEIDEV